MLRPLFWAPAALVLLIIAAMLIDATQAQAQVSRQFAPSAVRGELQIATPPLALLDGKPVQLAPGARIHGLDNLLMVSAALVGPVWPVRYVLDGLGQIREVWLLRADELQQP
jgi:hypothetical protein